MTTLQILFPPIAAFCIEALPDGCKITFLLGGIEEELYVKRPDGFGIPGKKHFVCKFKIYMG